MAEISAFLDVGHPLHTGNQRSSSLLCLYPVPVLVLGGEKSRISPSGKLDLSQVFLHPVVQGGCGELCPTAAVPKGWNPFGALREGLLQSKPEISTERSLDKKKKKYIVIVCVPVVGCRNQLSQLWHTDIPERLEMSQGCNCQPPGQHLSEQNLVTSVWEQKYLPNAEVRRKIWSQFPVSAQEKQLGWAPLPRLF